jgi:hypothetical protein
MNPVFVLKSATLNLHPKTGPAWPLNTYQRYILKDRNDSAVQENTVAGLGIFRQAFLQI